MANKKSDTTKAAPVASQVVTEKQEQTEFREPRYVVVREGHRVSANDYLTQDDPKALDELRFWKMVANKHSWGEPVEIVEFDNKLHRVFATN